MQNEILKTLWMILTLRRKIVVLKTTKFLKKEVWLS